MKYVFSLFIFLLATHAKGDCENYIPDSPDFAFARAILETPSSRGTKLGILQKSCSELDPATFASQFAHPRRPSSARVKPQDISIVIAMYSFPGNSKSEQDFKSELRALKKIQDPYERIKRGYELAIKHQGKYSRDQNGLPDGGNMLTTPGKMIRANERNEPIGVCRDFARLLFWIYQYLREPDFSGAQVDRDRLSHFDVSYETGAATIDGDTFGHAWIRVEVPRIREGGVEFDRFDLDPTFYSQIYTPVPPRHQQWSRTHLRVMRNWCKRFQRCLEQEQTQGQLAPTISPLILNDELRPSSLRQ